MSHVMHLKGRPANGGGTGHGDGTVAPRLAEQPQSAQEAAQSSGMFLYTDDGWSLRYFQEDDLHHLERQLFGKDTRG